MRIATRTVGAKIAIVEVAGALDAHTHAQLEAEFQKLIAAGRTKIVAQLDRLEYISSAGAGVFVGAVGLARERGGNIILLRPAPAVREVFDLLGLSQIFEMADDRDAALAALR